MALGNNGSGKSTGPLFILKVVDKDKDKKKVPPHFSITKKVNGKYEVQSETVNRVSGNLFKIDIKEQEWKGDKYNTISIYIKDGEEAYIVDLRFNMPSRSLFNGLASLESYDGIAITVYENKTGYTSFGLWQNDKMVKWKFKLDELPQPEAVTFKGKQMHDYSKVDDFFVNILKEISGKLGGSQATTKVAPPAAGAPESGGLDEDVPF